MLASISGLKNAMVTSSPLVNFASGDSGQSSRAISSSFKSLTPGGRNGPSGAGAAGSTTLTMA